jgi:ABC-type multidrug transport system fused ATPase/permease subunit
VRRNIRDGWSTLRLLYQLDRWAFVISSATSVLLSLVYPLILLIVWSGISLLLTGASQVEVIRNGVLLLGALFGLLAVQAVMLIVNETATGILKAESAQQVNARIMGKMSEVPYRFFEDNEFQARYGLVISQASYRPGMLVQSLVNSVTALGASLAIAATILALAPLLDVFLLILIPVSIVEARYHTRVIKLQTTAAPALFRMMYLTQKSIDATWQRDLRVHRSTVLEDEFRVLSRNYLAELKQLLRRYQTIRVGVALGSAAIMTLAMGTVFWHISQSSGGLAEAAILLPALVMGLNQGRSFAASWGTLMECLGYLTQVFDFLDQSYETRSNVNNFERDRRGVASGGSPPARRELQVSS